MSTMTNERKAWDDGLTEDEKAQVIAAYDAKERARVESEWKAEGSAEHNCDPADTYCGGCSVCGAVLSGQPS